MSAPIHFSESNGTREESVHRIMSLPRTLRSLSPNNFRSTSGWWTNFSIALVVQDRFLAGWSSNKLKMLASGVICSCSQSALSQSEGETSGSGI